MDTNAATVIIWTKLYNMDIYIHTVGNGIIWFNVYVLQIIDTLASWGKKNQDLLTNIFKGYGTCTDNLFVEYIQQK